MCLRLRVDPVGLAGSSSNWSSGGVGASGRRLLSNNRHRRRSHYLIISLPDINVISAESELYPAVLAKSVRAHRPHLIRDHRRKGARETAQRRPHKGAGSTTWTSSSKQPLICRQERFVSLQTGTSHVDHKQTNGNSPFPTAGRSFKCRRY